MKKIVFAFCILSLGFNIKSQQISVSEIARTAHFNKLIDEVNNGKDKIKYSDIKGIPYYYPNFIPAKVGNASGTIPIRYNSFLDTVEILNNTDVYEIPKTESFPDFTFETTKEKLVLVNTHDDFSGYFFELINGKNRLLKKIITKFYPETPAPNTLVPGTPARFEIQKPIYFIQVDNNIIKIPKKTAELISSLPSDKKDSVKDFIKTNKIKLTQEPDLIKLVNFLNN